MRGRRLFLNTILGVVIGAAACSNQQPAPTDPGMSPALKLLNGVTVLNCNPLAPASSSAVIGVAGGSISVGPHTLVVPPNALQGDVLITATTAAAGVTAVQFGPEGLQFAQPATLTLSFVNCGQWGQIKKLQIVYTDDNLNPLELIPSVADNQSKTITGSLQHFSQYAVAY